MLFIHQRNKINELPVRTDQCVFCIYNLFVFPGTTFSCIGAYQAGSGEVKVLEDKLGRKCIPSIVAFK